MLLKLWRVSETNQTRVKVVGRLVVLFYYKNEFSGVFGKYKFDKNGDIEGLSR